MKKKANQDQLKEIEQLKQEIDALKSLCNQKNAENENQKNTIKAMQWMLKPKQTASMDFVPDYGDLSDLNEDGLIKKSIRKQQLQDIVSEYLDLLESSAAIYEKNGDYALGIFSSGWCQMMDTASRKLCNTDDNRQALESGKWLCHDSCWKDASLKAMADGKPLEVACNGGINLYAVPVRANNQVIGAINFGFGSPPKDDAELKKLSKKYKIPLDELRKHAKSYIDRPAFIIDYAKQRIEKSAQHLGYLVERQMTQVALLRTQKTVDKSPLSVFWISPDGKFIYVNETAAEKLQYSREELLSMHVWDIDTNFPRETREKQFDIHRKHGGSVIESEHRRSDGKVIPVKINAHVLTFEDQEMEIAEVEDITERKQAEEALRESEEQHRRLFETMSQGVVYQSAEGTILSANPSAEKMLGLSLDQMRGKTSMDPRWKMITEEGEKVSGKDHPVMIALRTGKKVGPVTRGIYIPEKDKYVWLSLTATPLFRPGEEKPYQSYAVFDDITYKKHHEDEIKKQQRLLHTILGKLPIGIAINTLGSEPKVELINDNFARIYGIKTENLPTVESFWEVVYEDKTFRRRLKTESYLTSRVVIRSECNGRTSP